MKKIEFVENIRRHKIDLHMIADAFFLVMMCINLIVCYQCITLINKGAIVLNDMYSEIHLINKNAGIHYTTSATELVRLESKFFDISNDLKEIKNLAIIKGK